MNRDSVVLQKRPSRRKRELKRRVDEIVEAAETVFAEKGYLSATMEEIALRAEFAVGTIYRFFPGKGDLYAETLRRRILDYEAEIYGALDSQETAVKRIEAYFRCRLEQFWKNPNFFRLLFRGIHELTGDTRAGFLPDARQRYEKLLLRIRLVLGEGMEKGEFRKTDPFILCLALEGQIREYLFQMASLPNPARNHGREEQLLQLFLHGACTAAEGIK